MALILVIDDDEILRGVLAQALQYAGHTVRQAENGRDGMKLFNAETPDLVLTDIVMPVQEGVETILQIRQHSPRLPVIAMSGGVTNAKLYLGMAAKFGARRVLKKPFTPQELLDVVAEALAEAGKPGA